MSRTNQATAMRWRQQQEVTSEMGRPNRTCYEVYAEGSNFEHIATCCREDRALLVAAAPELLEACRELCQRLESNELVNRPNTIGNEYDQPAYDRAKAAIAKAEGRA